MHYFNDSTYYYFEDFVDLLYNSLSKSDEKKVESEILRKLQFDEINFDERTFIESAVETTIVLSLALLADKFIYEPKLKIKSLKNPECTLIFNFSDCKLKVNVESKCSYFQNRDIHRENNNFIGYVFEKSDVNNQLIQPLKLSDRSSSESYPPNEKLIEYLDSAKLKFPQIIPESELNILFVSCGELSDFDLWYKAILDFLYKRGKFSDFNVHGLVITNMNYNHYRYFKKNKRNNWLLNNHFNLMFIDLDNPFIIYNNLCKFQQFFKNFTNELYIYAHNSNNPILSITNNQLLISSFVKDNYNSHYNLSYFFSDIKDFSST
ncbi:MAG: hypothetical protein SFU91_15380 [Chloroherpetonaceae bacterium]|nr:hypothetical protein [Chloroherpetonaceae bacterium]